MAKLCINPKCEKEIPSSATFCSFCGTQQVNNENLSEEEKLRKELSEMQGTIQLLKKALANAQQNSDSSSENLQVIKNLQKQLADMQNKDKMLQNSLKNSPKPESKPFPYSILFVGLALLLIVGGSIAYFVFYKPYATDRDAPRYYTFSGWNTNLRSSPMEGNNIITKLSYGSELIVYDKGLAWSEVKWIDNQSNKAIKGYISSAYILSAEDFKILNSMWGDNESKEIIDEVRFKKALLNYFKREGSFKIYAKKKGTVKYNTIYYPRIVNPDSKFPDFAVIIKKESPNERRCLLFCFDDDETPHLVFDKLAPSIGDIMSIIYNSNTYDYNITYR